MKMKKYFKLLRVKHYIKNVLVLLPLICSGMLLQVDLLIKAAFAFVSFCLISSVVYILNDIHDVEHDRNHPTKRNRPIASGAISIKMAYVVAILLFVLAFFIHFFVCKSDIFMAGLLLLYFVLNVAYSMGLKNIALLDVVILASGFLIRLFYGGGVLDITISNWMYLTVLVASFYLGLGKRRNELKKISDGATREVLRFYSQNFLDKNMYMCLTLTIIFYSLWCIDPITTLTTGSTTGLLCSIPILIVVFMKYSLDVESESCDGDPVEVVLHDKMLLVLVALYACAMVGIIYL